MAAVETVLAPEEIFPRAEEPNPRNYTELEKKERDLTILAMMKDYPDLAGGQAWCEMIYDYCTHMEKDPDRKKELDYNINNKVWKNKKTHRNWKGGTVKCMENLTPEEYKEKYGKTGWEDKQEELNAPHGENIIAVDLMKIRDPCDPSGNKVEN